jgi:hypothetical protein
MAEKRTYVVDVEIRIVFLGDDPEKLRERQLPLAEQRIG